MSRTNEQLGNTTAVFDWNYYDREHRIKGNQGGTSSSKTYSILQVITMRLIEKKRIASVIGQDLPNLKRGALRDYRERILLDNPCLASCISYFRESKLYFRFYNGSILEFVSYEDEQDAKSGKRDIAFFNEANGIPYPIYKQVAMRTAEEIFIDFNPTAAFWYHEEVMSMKDSVTFFSNFTHNRFTSRGTLLELKEIKEKDSELWKVYGLGMTGEIGELCIPKIAGVVKEMPRTLKRRGYGVDFGYRADPTAVIDCGIMNENDLYLDQILYQKRMKLRDMSRLFPLVGIKRSRKMFADHADGRACDYLEEDGYNLQEVKKGPGSIKAGLSLINQCNIFITERSFDLLNERKKYAYKIEKRGPKAGQILNEPIDAFNHGWDGVRYYAMNNVKPRRGGRKSRDMRAFVT